MTELDKINDLKNRTKKSLKALEDRREELLGRVDANIEAIILAKNLLLTLSKMEQKAPENISKSTAYRRGKANV